MLQFKEIIMSVIHINQIQSKVKELFEKDIDISDINSSDPEKDIKVTTRCLAAYAVLISTNCSCREAALSIVDGGNDNGIDAIFYSPISHQMVIVQSKFNQSGTGEPDAASISKFCTGIRDLINSKFDRFNKKVQDKISFIKQAILDYETRYIMVLIDTCMAKSLADHSMRHINDLLSDLNNTGDEDSEDIVIFERYNQSKIHSSLAQKSGNIPIDIEVGLNQWGIISEPYKAFYGAVSGIEIADWWVQYKTRLFDKNIRQVLGRTEVNDELEKTIKESPQLFWYYNNGITIIADKIEKAIAGGNNRDIGTFKLSNIAIVNGAQTVSTIGKLAIQNSKDNNNLEDVKVLVRMIQLSGTPEGFGNNVTKSNNRQNRIENRDFVSQDPEQVRLKSELWIDGIEYNIMRSEKEVSNSALSFGLLDATTALACASKKVSLTVQVKSGIGKYFENLDRGIYKELFNKGTECYYVYNSVKIMRIIDNILSDKINMLDRKSGKDFLLLVHGNRMIELFVFKRTINTEDLKKKDMSIEESVLLESVNEIVERMKDFISTYYPDNFLATLFKNSTKCTEMDSYVMSDRQ